MCSSQIKLDLNTNLWRIFGKMESSQSLNPHVGIAQLIHIIHKGNNPKSKLWVNSAGILFNSMIWLATNLLICFHCLTSSPDFIKLVAISWIWCFTSMVASVETAEQSIWFQQIPAEEDIIRLSLQGQRGRRMLYIYTHRHKDRNTHTHTLDSPGTDGGAEVCGGGDLGLDCHNVQIHQIVEVEVEDAAICGDMIGNTLMN